MKIGWGIIGIGQHSDTRVAPAIRSAEGGRLVAVYSRDITRAETFASKHNAQHAYDSIDRLLANPSVEAVYVASPNSLHAEHTVRAAEAGRHVLCEKPMALSVADCRSMISACGRGGVKLGVGFHLRHHPAHVEAREMVLSGQVGPVVLVQAQWAHGVRGQVSVPARTGLSAWWSDPAVAGGGTMMGTGVHAIDLIRYVTGRDVAEVSAFTDGGTEERPLESLATVIMKLVGGAFAILTCSRIIPDPDNDIVVYGSKMRLSAKGTLSQDYGCELELVGEDGASLRAYRGGDLYRLQIEAFQRCIHQGLEPDASGADGLAMVEIVNAIFESNRTGKKVLLSTARA